MNKDSKEFLYELLHTPSPSGFEVEIQKVVANRVSSYAEYRKDVHGNLIATVNPEGPIRVMLAGHCDQIGFMVTHIDNNGFIYFRQIGGIDPSVVPGTNLKILSEKGEVDGIIGYKPVHLVPQKDRGKAISLSSLWIDIGASSRKEAEKKVSVGDPIVYRPGVTELGKTKISSSGLDDKVGTFVVMEALRLFESKVSKLKKRHAVSLHAVSTVQEEIGLRGARTSCYGVDPHVGIAVDVTHATDNPGADEKKVGTVELGEGPAISKGANINPVIGGMLVKTAKSKKIKYQMLASPAATGTDANAIQISKAGVAAALIGIPNRYMHTQVEVVDLKDLEESAKLIAETCLSITEKADFIP